MTRGGFRRLAVAAACALLVPAAGVASAAPGTPGLTVIGAGNTSAPLVISRATTLRLGGDRDGLVLSGGKSYVGLAVHDSSGALLAAIVHPKQFTADGRAFYMSLGPRRDELKLQPGRYRVTLLADGPAQAAVAASGLAAPTRVRTRDRAADIQAAAMPLNSSLPLMASGSAELDVARNSTFGLFTFAEFSAPAHTERWFCLRPLPASCSARENDFRTSSSALGLGNGWVSTTSFSTSGAPAGRYLAATGAATAAASDRQVAFAISIPGSPPADQ